MTRPIKDMPLDALTVYTTNGGEPFTGRDSAILAYLVLRRFGRDVEAAAAWRRMLGNSCSDTDFAGLAAIGEEVDKFGSR